MWCSGCSTRHTHMPPSLCYLPLHSSPFLSLSTLFLMDCCLQVVSSPVKAHVSTVFVDPLILTSTPIPSSAQRKLDFSSPPFHDTQLSTTSVDDTQFDLVSPSPPVQNAQTHHFLPKAARFRVLFKVNLYSQALGNSLCRRLER